MMVEEFAEEFETFYQSAELAPMLQFEINLFWSQGDFVRENMISM